MGYWKKTFLDGSFTLSTDENEVSWRSSKNNNLGSVEISDDEVVMKIIVDEEHEFWQSDSFEISLLTHQHNRIYRRVSVKLQQGDVVYVSENSEGFAATVSKNKYLELYRKKEKLDTEEEWFVLEHKKGDTHVRTYLINRRL